MSTSSMTDEHRRALRNCRVSLVQDISESALGPILNILFQNEVLTLRDRRHIKAGEICDDRNERLLDILPTKGGKAYQCFLDALEDSSVGLQHLATKIVSAVSYTGTDSVDSAPLAAAISSTTPCAVPYKDNLPKLTSKFTGRVEAVERGLAMLDNIDMKMINFRGAPGFGKTSLSLAVGHKVKDKRTVIFETLRNVCAVNDITDKLLLFFGIGSEKTKVDRTNQLCKILKNDFHKTLLILDNAETALQEPMKIDFLDFLHRMTSVPNLQIITTSREKIESRLVDVTEFSVECLSNESSMSLLLTETQKGLITTDEAEALCQYCAGCPLAILVVAGLLNENFSVNELIEGLKHSPYGELEQSIDLSYSHLNEMQTPYRLLSVFPAPFTVEAAMSILEMHSTLEVKTTLLKLVNRSLLERDGEKYSFHPLLKTYASKKLAENKAEEKAAHFRYVAYYTDLMCRLTNQYYSQESAFAMRTFHSEKINIEKAILSAVTDKDMSEHSKKLMDYLILIFLFRHISLQNYRIVCENALDIAERKGYTNEKNECLQGLTFLEYYVGHYKCAVQHAEKIIRNLDKSLHPIVHAENMVTIAMSKYRGSKSLKYVRDFFDNFDLKSLPEFDTLPSKTDQIKMAFFYGNYANTSRVLGKVEAESFAYSTTARMLNRLFGPHPEVGALMLNHSAQQRSIKDYQGSLDTCESLMKMCEDYGMKSTQVYFLSQHYAALALQNLSRLEDAHSRFKQGIGILMKMGWEDTERAALLYHDLGLFFVETEKYTDAVEQFQMSLKVRETIDDSKSGMVDTCKQLAEVYKRLHQTDKANEYMEKVKQIENELETDKDVEQTSTLKRRVEENISDSEEHISAKVGKI